MNEDNETAGLVTVGKFLAPTEAQMAKGMLETAGIECFLLGENANNMLAFAFRVRLQVQRKDEAEACELLAASQEEPRAGGFGG